jgi:hypothetical protein
MVEQRPVGERAGRPVTFIPPELVHCTSRSSVFLTDDVGLRDGNILVGARLPRSAPGEGSDGACSLTGVVEVVRQTGIYVAHRFFSVPLGWHFVFATMTVEVAGGFPAGGSAAVLDVRQAREPKRTANRYHADCEITLESADGGCLQVAVEILAVAPATYQRLRRGRTLPPADAQLPASGAPLDPRSTGCRSPHEVLLRTPADPTAAEPRCWELGFGAPQRARLDHPADHVQGMVLLEAMRQAAALVTPPDRAALRRVEVSFDSFGEWGEPTAVRAEAPDGPELTVTVAQGDRRVARLTLLHTHHLPGIAHLVPVQYAPAAPLAPPAPPGPGTAAPHAGLAAIAKG